MVREEYVTLKIPMSLVKKIDELIASGKGGYRSRAEVVKDAVRRLLKEYGYAL